MNDDIREFGTGLGQRVIARDWAGVHGLLAPWMQSELSVGGVRAFFEDAYRDVLSENDVEGMHFPASFRVGAMPR